MFSASGSATPLMIIKMIAITIKRTTLMLRMFALHLLFSMDIISPSPEMLPPARGFISSQPAENWEHGLICGNGTIGVNSLSRPLDETIIFSHSGLFLPIGKSVNASR